MTIRTEYPRPQLRRENFLTLNGMWEFAFGEDGLDRSKGEGGFPLQINVPFCYRSALSGIGTEEEHCVVWYRRCFTPLKGRNLLCFNGCDYETDVWVNGVHAMHHTGAYNPFEADITDLLREGENELVVRCKDNPESAQPRGKQSWTGKPFSCWYTPTTGIYMSVWIESFETDCIAELSLLSDLDGFALYGELVPMKEKADEAEFILSFKGEELARARFSLGESVLRYRIPLGEKREDLLWFPGHPALIDADVFLYCGGKLCDRVHTRCGMRKISTDGEGNILINGKRLYQRLVLDQGYWAESGLTPPSVEALKKDILLSQAMGFNGARKHQKIEDPYYYYYAEELGFLTWCEMPSAYVFHTGSMEALTRQWLKIVARARSFTSIVCYVPFNESWGVPALYDSFPQQEFVRAIYHLTRALDPTRPVSSNDGWECLDCTDIVGIHDYAAGGGQFPEKYARDRLGEEREGKQIMAKGCSYRGQPVLLTEFGGIALKSDTVGENWGYNAGAADAEAFFLRYRNLLEGVYESNFQGFCYTQLTDVEQEVNGLLSPDRTPKFDVARLRELNETFGRRKP